MDSDRKEIMKTSLVLIVVVGLIAGCATKPPPPAATVYDPVTGERHDVTEMFLPSPVDQPREVVYLASYRENQAFGTQTKYYMSIRYVAKSEVGLVEIPPGKTLTLIADGQPINLDGTGSINMRKNFQQKDIEFVTETAIYPVSKADLQKLGFARKIQVQIKGSRGNINREFVPENYENLRDFVRRAAL
jgi:hypothetical protein